MGLKPDTWKFPLEIAQPVFSSHSASYYDTTFSSNLAIQKSPVKKSIFKLTFEIMAAHGLSPTWLMKQSLSPLKFY